MKTLSIILLSLGAVAIGSIVYFQFHLEELRKNVKTIQESAKIFDSGSGEYLKLIETSHPLLRDIENINDFNVILLISGPILLLLGIFLFIKSRKK